MIGDQKGHIQMVLNCGRTPILTLTTINRIIMNAFKQLKQFERNQFVFIAKVANGITTKLFIFLRARQNHYSHE